MANSNYPSELPDRIKQKINLLEQGIKKIESHALGIVKTSMNEPVSLFVQNQTMTDLLSDYERGQSISFISRYENLPSLMPVKIVHHQGNYFIGNMTHIRHILNEYRSVIHNESDSVYYQNVHKLCFKMLQEDNYRKGTTINILTKNDEDVTETFMTWLGEHNSAIKFVLRTLDLDYIYNGILQHSDGRFSKRFVKEYMSGEINYIFWKHILLLDLIKDLLKPYYMLMVQFSFPKLGPL
jgi:hypothetical protein